MMKNDVSYIVIALLVIGCKDLLVADFGLCKLDDL